MTSAVVDRPHRSRRAGEGPMTPPPPEDRGAARRPRLRAVPRRGARRPARGRADRRSAPSRAPGARPEAARTSGRRASSAGPARQARDRPSRFEEDAGPAAGGGGARRSRRSRRAPGPRPGTGGCSRASRCWCSLPFAVSVWYLYARAADQYHSEVAFSIRSEEGTSAAAAGILGALTQIGSGSASDTDILFEYIRSQRIVEEIDPELDLRAMFRKRAERPGVHPRRRRLDRGAGRRLEPQGRGRLRFDRRHHPRARQRLHARGRAARSPRRCSTIPARW